MSTLKLLQGSKQFEDLSLSAHDGCLVIENIGHPEQSLQIPLDPMRRGKLVFLHPIPRETKEGSVGSGNISIRCARNQDIVTITWFDVPGYGTITWHVSLFELNKALEEKTPREHPVLVTERQIDEGFE